WRRTLCERRRAGPVLHRGQRAPLTWRTRVAHGPTTAKFSMSAPAPSFEDQRGAARLCSRMKKLSWLLLATLGLSSCAKPEPPRVTPKAVHLGAVGAQGVRVSVELDVYNP